MLGASLAVRIHHPPISSLAELIESNHEILAMQNTSTYRYFAKVKVLIILLDKNFNFYRINLSHKNLRIFKTY